MSHRPPGRVPSRKTSNIKRQRLATNIICTPTLYFCHNVKIGRPIILVRTTHEVSKVRPYVYDIYVNSSDNVRRLSDALLLSFPVHVKLFYRIVSYRTVYAYVILPYVHHMTKINYV